MSEVIVSALMRKNMSKFQKKVWKLIGEKGNIWEFVPEVSFSGYVMDFYSQSAGVAIEADGPHHLHPVRQRHDHQREKVLLEKGIKTLHITPAMLIRYSGRELFEYIDNFIRSASAGDNEKDEE